MSDGADSTALARIVWFELPARDTARAQDFYRELFGWSFEQFAGMDYHVAGAAGGAIHGDPSGGGIMTYFGVEDVEASARRVQELGGSAGDRHEIPGVGFYVQCQDVDGNRFGLYQDTAA